MSLYPSLDMSAEHGAPRGALITLNLESRPIVQLDLQWSQFKINDGAVNLTGQNETC